MRRVVLLLLLLALAACRRRGDVVAIDFRDDGMVDLKVTSQLKGDVGVTTDAILAGRDPWSIRFNRLEAEQEALLLEKSRGELTAAQHSARMSREQLERFFFDVNLTLHVDRGEGWSELAIVPGTSDRATRQERERFDRALEAFSRDASRYFEAMNRLYSYLDREPQRAKALFQALFVDEESGGEPVPLMKGEQPLVNDVRRTMVTVAQWVGMSGDDDRAEEFAKLADLCMNPFPADFSVQTPTLPFQVEGFQRSEDVFRIDPPELVDALKSLEGKWVSPEPLAAMLRKDDESIDATIERLSTEPRRSTSVVPAVVIAAAIRENMKPAALYRLRWIEKR